MPETDGPFEVLFALPEALETLLNALPGVGRAPMNITKLDEFPAVEYAEVVGATEWLETRLAVLPDGAKAQALTELQARELFCVVAVEVPKAAAAPPGGRIVVPGGAPGPNPFG